MESRITAFRISFFPSVSSFQKDTKTRSLKKIHLVALFLWVILLCLNFMCGRFGTICPIFIGGVSRKSRKILILKTFKHISLIQATIQRHGSVHIYTHQSDTGHYTAPQLSTHLCTSVWHRPLYSATAQYTFIHTVCWAQWSLQCLLKSDF